MMGAARAVVRRRFDKRCSHRQRPSPMQLQEPMPPNPRKRVTSSQVAQRAGVSRTTVSFVLNGVNDMGISQETRDRVLEAARQLGYVPNAAARMLVSGTTGTIALVVPHSVHVAVDAFVPRLLNSINEYCHAEGFSLLLEPMEDFGVPGAYRQLVDSRRIDGLIMLNPRRHEHEHLAELARDGFPLVVLGLGFLDLPGVLRVDGDGRSAARQATEHLLRLGHRRIAHISYAPTEEYESARLRQQGYLDALLNAGLQADPAHMDEASFDAASSYAAMQRILSRGAPPTALFASNDTVAFGAMSALRDAGLRIPEDVAVVGYDDIPLAAYATPPLTTVRVSPEQNGTMAARALFGLLRGETPSALVQWLDSELVIRRSCGSG